MTTIKSLFYIGFVSFLKAKFSFLSEQAGVFSAHFYGTPLLGEIEVCRLLYDRRLFDHRSTREAWIGIMTGFLDRFTFNDFFVIYISLLVCALICNSPN